MTGFDVFDAHCPSRDALDDVTGRWGVLVLVALLDCPSRFAATARAVGGISDRMLARTLRVLEADGLVVRTQRRGAQRVDYALTAPGERLAGSLRVVVEVLYEVMPGVLDARERARAGADASGGRAGEPSATRTSEPVG